TYHIRHQVDVSVSHRGEIRRRDFLRGIAATSVAAGTLSWRELVALQARELQKRGKAVIMLWMAGGPSQFETFSPKPGHENGGDTKAISTSVPGIQIADSLPNVAKVMDNLAIIRSMTSKEGSHPRATFLLHHGYLPMGGVKFPTLGSHVAQQIGQHGFDLPSFVRIGGRGTDAGGAGFLGVGFGPFILQNPEAKPENTQPATRDDRYNRRLKMLEQVETNFGKVEGTDLVADHQKLIHKSSKMILSPKMEAFDLGRESEKMRDAYGRTKFGAGCLLARRLVEAGVTFVEVNQDGWDTHDNNFERTRTNNGSIDQPMAQLITDLRQRGMLDRTLVIWMGEFGRTP